MEYSEERRKYNENNALIADVFKNYAECFNEIDKIYDEIDGCDDGFNFNKLRAVINKLAGFQEWNKIVKDSLKAGQNKGKETQETINFESIISSHKLDYSELCQKLMELQEKLRSYFEYDIGFIIQTDCIDIINKTLNKVKEQEEPDSKDNKIEYFETISYLKELVSDITLAVSILSPLMQWDYGTVKFAYLSSRQQLSALLNQAIVLDRMYVCQHKLEVVLYRLHKIINGFCVVSDKVLYVAGLLNFKIHKYDNAIKCFERIDKQDTNLLNETERFHTALLYAYCYEYKGNFEDAIRKLCAPVDKINTWLNETNEEDVNTKLMKFRDGNKTGSSLFYQFFEAKSFDEQLSETVKFEQRIEILHALAHCINEYAIQKIKEKEKDDSSCVNKINYPLMLSFARNLMLYITQYKPEYYTCYATIHGEYNDYDEAIALIDRTREKVPKRETLMAEIAFFKYYFSLLNNKPADEENAIFNIYARKYADDDAKCHSNVFEIRKALRDFYHKLINSKAVAKDNELTELHGSLEKSYQRLCQMPPSLYMNANVRHELRRMQRAFVYIDDLYKIMLTGKLQNIFVTDLLNEWKRFDSAKSESGLDSTKETSQKENGVKISVLDCLYNEETGIIKSLYSSSSIFILAPISGVVVYQYQTGKRNELFSEEDITSGKQVISSIDIKEIRVNYASHRDWVSLRLPEIEWDKIQEVKAYFLWSTDIPHVVHCAYSDTKQSIARQIVDVENFRKIINEAKIQFDKDQKEYACYKNRHCRLIENEDIAKLEIIKDTNKRFIDKLFYYLLLEDPSTFQIIVTNKKFERCVEEGGDKPKGKIHGILCEVKPKSIIDMQRTVLVSVSNNVETQKNEEGELNISEIGRLIDVCNELITRYKNIVKKIGETDTGKAHNVKISELEKIRGSLEKLKNCKSQEQIKADCGKYEKEIYKIEGSK